jgi:hypothetical protein
MECTVYPNVTIGDGTVVFAGLTVSSSLPGNKAIVPSRKVYHIMPASIVKFGVDDQVCLSTMERAFKRLPEAFPEGILDCSRSDVWQFSVPGKGRVVLLRDRSYKPIKEIAEEPTVVWRLRRDAEHFGVLTFEFAEQLVSGGWTPFADKIADFLCRVAGIHFAFEDRLVKTKPVVGS